MKEVAIWFIVNNLLSVARNQHSVPLTSSDRCMRSSSLKQPLIPRSNIFRVCRYRILSAIAAGCRQSDLSLRSGWGKIQHTHTSDIATTDVSLTICSFFLSDIQSSRSRSLDLMTDSGASGEAHGCCSVPSLSEILPVMSHLSIRGTLVIDRTAVADVTPSVHS